MKVAVSITKVFVVDDIKDLEELRHRMEDLQPNDEDYIDWYDLEPEGEMWSYGRVA